MSFKENKSYIQTLYLVNFKKFSRHKIEFTSGMNILVGPNNSGKSTILDAIKFLITSNQLKSLDSQKLFNDFSDGSRNEIVLLAKVKFDTKAKINLTSQLKLGKGSPYSTVGFGTIGRELSVQDIIDPPYQKDEISFNRNMSKIETQGLDEFYIKTIISCDENYNFESVSELFFIKEKRTNIVKISDYQKNYLFNYLHIDSNRVSNKALTDSNSYNWLSKYYLNYLSKNKKIDILLKTVGESKIEIDLGNDNINKKLLNIFDDIKIDFKFYNSEYLGSIIENIKIYIDDGILSLCNDKAQGMQSILIIVLFLEWLEFKSKNLQRNEDLWSSILTLEEPEIHLHDTAKKGLIKLLNKSFVEEGLQLFFSTHDETFLKWSLDSNTNIILTDKFGEEEDFCNINNLNVNNLDELKKRYLRFNTSSLFTKSTVVVEGSEEVCLSDINTHFNIDLQNNISINRLVGNVRKKRSSETSDVQASGGSGDILSNYKFYSELGIHPVFLIDIDNIINIKNIKEIYECRTDNELDYTSCEGIEFKVNDNHNMKNDWYNHKDKLKDILEELEKAGIFFFPGDFESLFKDEYLKDIAGQGKLIKEKHVYDVKESIRCDIDVDYIFDSKQIEYYKKLCKRMNLYIKENTKQKDIKPANNKKDLVTDKDNSYDYDDLPF